MNKVALITLVLGAVGGYLIGAHSGTPQMEEEIAHESEHIHHHNDHKHEMREVIENIPTVDLVIHDDPAGGYIAEVKTTNFRFAPENVSKEDVAGEGHAHIYVDGEKINRLLGQWYNIGKLDSGEHVLEVRLSSNDHFELASGGELISDSETVIAK